MIEISNADDARAEQMLAPYRARRLPGARISPQWVPGGARFRYQVGSRHLVVEPTAGTSRDAVDHDRLAAALSKASGHAVEADHLPISNVEFDVPDRDTLRFSAFDARWVFSDGRCVRIEEGEPAGLREIVSLNKRWIAFRRDGNIWARSSDGEQEFALTDDAEPHHEYGGTVVRHTSHRGTGGIRCARVPGRRRWPRYRGAQQSLSGLFLGQSR